MHMRAYLAALTAATALAVPASASALTFSATSACNHGTVTVTAKFSNVTDAEKPISAVVDTVSAERGRRVIVNGYTFDTTSGVLTITVPDAIKDHHGALEGGDDVTAWFQWPNPADPENPIRKLYLNDFAPLDCYPAPAPAPAVAPLTAAEAKAAVRARLTYPRRWRLRTVSATPTAIMFRGRSKRRHTVRYFTATRTTDGSVGVVRSRTRPR